VAKFRNRLKERRRTYIREWREFRNLTQEQLAERIGASNGAISQLERGLTAYTQPMLEALADALMCEPADLLMRDPTQPGAIWSIWEHAKPAERQQLDEMAKVIVPNRRTGTGGR
jgi:transcriptional regulator with XRE-family HTH domain